MSTNQNIGSSVVNTNANTNVNTVQLSQDEQLYLHKAKKYHEKIRMRLTEMQKGGKPIPAGYEKYLKPFNPNF